MSDSARNWLFIPLLPYIPCWGMIFVDLMVCYPLKKKERSHRKPQKGGFLESDQGPLVGSHPTSLLEKDLARQHSTCATEQWVHRRSWEAWVQGSFHKETCLNSDPRVTSWGRGRRLLPFLSLRMWPLLPPRDRRWAGRCVDGWEVGTQMRRSGKQISIRQART